MHFDSVLVSTTEVCTVGCRHCGFTGSTRDRQPEAGELEAWVSGACDFGVPKIIFTGGEPFQRFHLLKGGVAAAAGHASQPEIGIFTSSFWGRSAKTVHKLLNQLDGVTQLYLSTDLYHQERVPVEYVKNVIDGALELGVRDVSLCITIGEDWEEAHIRSMYSAYEGDVLIHVDRVISTPFISTKHGDGLAPTPDNYSPDCFLETPLINPNGDLSACHIGKSGAYIDLSEQVYFLGNLHERSFGQLMQAAETNYEYQFLRVFGPQGVARMIVESPELRDHFKGRRFANGCDLCYKVLRSPAGRRQLQVLAADPDKRRAVDAARALVFEE